MKVIRLSVRGALVLCVCALLLAGGDGDPLSSGREEICPGDLDRDRSITVHDLEMMVAAFGHAPGHRADLNGDDNVTIADVEILAGTWGPCDPVPGMSTGQSSAGSGSPSGSGSGEECPADFNGNGIIDMEDLDALIDAWGPCTLVDPVTFFGNAEDFAIAVEDTGQVFDATEDFEAAAVEPEVCLGMNDPLDSTTDNDIFDPGDILSHIAFQSNIDAPGLLGPNPRGEIGIVACGPGAFNAADKAVAPNFFGDSCDILALAPIYTAIRLTIGPGLEPNPIEVRVFDESDVLIGQTTVMADPAGTFVGIIMRGQVPIGRINLWNPATENLGTEYIYDLETYVNSGDSCPHDLDGSGVVGIGDLLMMLSSWGLCTDEGSAVGNTSTDGTDVEITEPGLYYLAVCVTPRDPVSDPGGIYFFADPLEVSGPDGLGGGESINAWNEAPPNGGAAPGDYVILLSGVTFSTPPANDSTYGPDFVEDVIDAGPLTNDAKETVGTGPLQSISGNLGGTTVGSGSGDFEDMYLIQIEDPALFSATTAAPLGGSTEFNSRLFLFDFDGFGLLGNEDVASGAVSMPLDIKPGNCPNSFNRNSNGVLPVAVLGTINFDAAEIDPLSVTLLRADGVGGGVGPRIKNNGQPHASVDDVATPIEGVTCECHDPGIDGLLDMNIKFVSNEVVDVLELDDLPQGDVVELVVTGAFLDGTPFVSTDCISLVPQGSPPGFLSVRGSPSETFLEVTPLDNQLDGGGFGAFDRDYPIGTIVTLTAPTVVDGRPLTGWLWNGIPLRKYRTDATPGESYSVSVIIIYEVQNVEPLYAPAVPGDGNGR